MASRKDTHEVHENAKKAKHVKNAKKETSEKTSENATHVAHEDNKKTTHAKKNAPAYNDLGTGKCVVNGEDPEYEYLDGQGSDCEDLCTGSVDCYGYSVSSSNNCLLWTQPGLSGGGEEWGGANCHVKRVKGIKKPLELFSGSLGKGTGQKTETALTEEDSEQTFEKDIHEAHEDGKKANHVKHAKKETSEKTSEKATHVAHEDNKKSTHTKNEETKSIEWHS